jgi:hypothetical protein
MPLVPNPHRVQSVPRITKGEADAYFRNAASRRRPVVIDGLANHWPALTSWTPDFFEQRYGHQEITVEGWQNGAASAGALAYLSNRRYAKEPMGNAIARMRAGGEAPGTTYIAYADIFRAIPELDRDIEPIHETLGVSKYAPRRLRRRLCLRPGFWLGPGGTVTPAHFDRQDNFNVQVTGRKRWTLFAPGDSDNLYFLQEVPVPIYSPVDVEHPDMRRHPRFRAAQPYETVLRPGDVLYLPAGWWHHVRTLEMSITLNFWWWTWRGVGVAARAAFYQAAIAKNKLQRGEPADDPVSMPTD